MLIALNDGNDISERLTFANEFSANINGTTRIYNPRTCDDFIETVKAYKPTRENLILLTSHYELGQREQKARQRVIDILFDRQGGSVWGTPPAPFTSGTYVAGLDTPAEKIISTALYSDGRAKFVRKMSTKYFGRSSADPHTIIVGFLPSTKPSLHGNYLVRSLSASRAADESHVPWWFGVGYTNTEKKALETVQWFEYSSIISLGDAAHDALVDAGIEHAAMPSMRELFKKTTTLEPDEKLGGFIRELSRRRDLEDHRDWRN